MYHSSEITMRVIVFGVFDMHHLGHEYFLRNALVLARRPEDLTVVVTRDIVVHLLKRKVPHQSERTRMAALKEYLPPGCKIILGDAVPGDYSMIRNDSSPEELLICFGCDQDGLKKDMITRMEKGDLPRALTHTVDEFGTNVHTSYLYPSKPVEAQL